MRILLGIDTSSRTSGVAVLAGGALLASRDEPESQRHSRRLLELVQEATREAGIGLGDLASIAVAVGPGSFTGIRVGLATAQGLAFGLSRPLGGVPSLLAYAALAPLGEGGVVAVIEGRKEEVFVGRFRRTADGLEADGEPKALPPGECFRRWVAPGDQVVGPGALRYRSLFHEVCPEGRLVEEAASAAFAVARIADSAAGQVEARPLYLQRPPLVMAEQKRGRDHA